MEIAADPETKEPISVEVLSFLRDRGIQILPNSREALASDPERKHGTLLFQEIHKVGVTYLSVALRDKLWLQPYDHHKQRAFERVQVTLGEAQVELKVPGVGWLDAPVCRLGGPSLLHAEDSETILQFGVCYIVASHLLTLINERFSRHKERLTAEREALERADLQACAKRSQDLKEESRVARDGRKKKRKTGASKKPTK